MNAGTNDNVIEDNRVTGNTNGIVLVAGTTGNIIRRNVVVANPPLQVSVTFPQAGGVDIRNGATPGANTIDDNVCMTALNAACPAVDAHGRHDKPPKDK